ncbi:thioredoxin-disulfide reductase [Candidatus Uhrbacteria bacterium]|jgi:thioredoxin reductase (NADPH)|nr:thioredoxin-disulfide reductase [Candidatus Uhrbacteria bacterium]
MRDVVILGSGPAGLTAAIYAARADLKPLVVHGPQPGGQLTITTEVDNWPGFENGVMGPELMEEMKKQAARFGTEYKEGWVEKVDLAEDKKVLTFADGSTLETKALIVTTGATAMWLDIPGEQEFQGKGVSACATCDGFFFRDKKVLIVGGGDTALEEATFLTKFASEVVMLVRRDEFRGSKAMQKKARENDKITIMWDTSAIEVLGDGKVTGAKIVNNKTKEESEISADGFFVAIGHKPNTDLFKGQLDMLDSGYLTIAEPFTTKTKVPGVFAAGDVADHVYRQAVTAAGTGCMAALDAERWLAE